MFFIGNCRDGDQGKGEGLYPSYPVGICLKNLKNMKKNVLFFTGKSWCRLLDFWDTPKASATSKMLHCIYQRSGVYFSWETTAHGTIQKCATSWRDLFQGQNLEWMKIWGLTLDIGAFLKTACHPKGQFDFKGVKSSPAEGLAGIVHQVVSMKEFMKPIPCQRFWRGHVIATQFVGGEMALDPVDPTKISCGPIPHRWSTQTDMAWRTAFCGHSRTMGCGKGSDIGASSAGTRSKNTSSVTFSVTFSVTVASLGPASDFFSGFFLANPLASALALAALAAKAWAASAFCFWKFFFRISRSWRTFSIRSSKSFWNSLQSCSRESAHMNGTPIVGMLSYPMDPHFWGAQHLLSTLKLQDPTIQGLRWRHELGMKLIWLEQNVTVDLSLKVFTLQAFHTTSERENSHGNDVDTGGAKVSTIPLVVWYNLDNVRKRRKSENRGAVAMREIYV